MPLIEQKRKFVLTEVTTRGLQLILALSLVLAGTASAKAQSAEKWAYQINKFSLLQSVVTL